MHRQLSPKSSAGVLKKDAKRWLDALRAGDADARHRLLAAWPAAPAEPTLRDVQHALAREYGLDGWKSLLSALDDFALDRQTRDERIEAVLRHGWDGDASLARRIVARFPDLRRESLFTAAACGDVDEVRRCLTRDPRAATSTGGSRAWTALAYVAYSRIDAEHAVEIARMLLDAGADPRFSFDDGWGNPFTLITGAIGLGEGVKATHPQAAELVELLIERGADPYDTQALYNSSIVGDDVTWMERLWDHCARQGSATPWSQVEGRSIGGKMRLSTVDYLLGNAVAQNHLARAAWLLEHGAHATTLHAYALIPVHTHARLAGFADMMALLERHGARAEALDGARAVQAALMAGDEGAVRARVAADPSLLRNPSLLLAAAEHGRAREVALLLELGAAVDAVDARGASALHLAAGSGSVETIDALLAGGADVDRRDSQWQSTPMGWACHLRQEHVADRLAPITRDVRALARSARVERLDAVLQGEPALANHRLAKHDDPTPLFCLPDDDGDAVDVARVLLVHGADPHVRNPAGKSPAEVARFRGLDEAATLLSRSQRTDGEAG